MPDAPHNHMVWSTGQSAQPCINSTSHAEPQLGAPQVKMCVWGAQGGGPGEEGRGGGREMCRHVGGGTVGTQTAMSVSDKECKE